MISTKREVPKVIVQCVCSASQQRKKHRREHQTKSSRTTADCVRWVERRTFGGDVRFESDQGREREKFWKATSTNASHSLIFKKKTKKVKTGSIIWLKTCKIKTCLHDKFVFDEVSYAYHVHIYTETFFFTLNWKKRERKYFEHHIAQSLGTGEQTNAHRTLRNTRPHTCTHTA